MQKGRIESHIYPLIRCSRKHTPSYSSTTSQVVYSGQRSYFLYHNNGKFAIRGAVKAGVFFDADHSAKIKKNELQVVILSNSIHLEKTKAWLGAMARFSFYKNYFPKSYGAQQTICFLCEIFYVAMWQKSY